MRNCFLKVIDTRVQTCCVRIEAPSCTRSTYCPHPRTTSEPARQWWEEVRPLLPLAAPSGAALVHNTLEEQAQVSKRAPGAGPPLCCLSHLSPDVLLHPQVPFPCTELHLNDGQQTHSAFAQCKGHRRSVLRGETKVEDGKG